MAASAYASLVSLSRLLKQVLHPSKQHWIGFDRDQMMPLDDKVSSLVHLFEKLSNRRQSSKLVTEELKNQLANAGNEAEDLIDSFVADMFRAIKRTDQSDDDPTEVENQLRELKTRFCEDISRVTETMDLMNQKLIEIQNKMDDHHQHAEDDEDALSRRPAAPTSSSGKNVMVGFEYHLDQMIDKLATTKSELQIIPIVGMGGIGKTTLARNIYENPKIVDYFHARAWVTLSQTFNIRKVLLGLLYDALNVKETKKEFKEKMTEIKDEEIGEQLCKSLFGRKYLIVIDDIWSITAWDGLKRLFPHNQNGSRIMITTRQSDVAIHLTSAGNYHKLDFLDEDKSWNLFCDKAFPLQDFPVEFEKIGKKISKGCGGLPLAIVTIGRLLANSGKTPEYWEYVSENFNSIINSGDDEYCLKLLSLSYNDLPIHLKPCFLYMAMFPEDCEIAVSRLTRMWVAEGFLKPIKDESLEDVGMIYLKDLIDRNLILVSKQESNGNIETFKIHDVLRDLCIREAHKENFICEIRVPLSLNNIPEGIERKRRLGIRQSTGGEFSESPQEGLNGLESASNARSLVCWFEWISSSLLPSLNLVRILDANDKYSLEEITKLSSLRYVDFGPHSPEIFMSEFIRSKFPQWNLQTFVCHERVDYAADMPSQIWEMTELRHLRLNAFTLPDPPPPPESDNSDTQNFCILENLQTLIFVANLRCTKEVIIRIPNLRILAIVYDELPTGGEEWCINNLVYLHKLESLSLGFMEKISATNIAFPCSLKKLRLIGCGIPWSDIKVVGSLPQLELLFIDRNAFEGERWDATEGEFVRLKSLLISKCDLKYWTADNNTYFPMLEKLELECSELEEIPIGLAEIPTLKSIDLEKWKPSVIASAKKILEERDNFGYEGLEVEYYNEEQDCWMRIEMNEED